jgi:hypothetical protein
MPSSTTSVTSLDPAVSMTRRADHTPSTRAVNATKLSAGVSSLNDE